MNERIKILRKELDLTQQCFAEKIGTSANVLTNYETGRRNPSSSVINNICKTFNVNEEWLRNGTGEMFVQRDKLQIISEFAADLIKEPDSVKARLFEALAKLDDKDWLAIEMILDKITSPNEKG